MPLLSTYQIDHVGVSDVGLVRGHNEDVWVAYPEQGLFLLADGMGGHAAGEVAAHTSLTLLAHHVAQWKPKGEVTQEEAVAFFRTALIKVNAEIYRQGQEEPALTGMGTTVCLLYFFHTYAVVAHVGDSRVYHVPRGGELTQLTEDHSLVAELVSLGTMSAREGDAFPYKHILTRALGTNPLVEPSVQALSVEPGDLFLLCSDGLTNYVTDSEIAAFLLHGSLEARAERLVSSAKEQGGGDNITVLLVAVQDDLPR